MKFPLARTPPRRKGNWPLWTWPTPWPSPLPRWLTSIATTSPSPSTTNSPRTRCRGRRGRIRLLWPFRNKWCSAKWNRWASAISRRQRPYLSAARTKRVPTSQAHPSPTPPLPREKRWRPPWPRNITGAGRDFRSICRVQALKIRANRTRRLGTQPFFFPQNCLLFYGFWRFKGFWTLLWS